MFPPGFEHIAKKKEIERLELQQKQNQQQLLRQYQNKEQANNPLPIFNKNSNVFSGQTLHQQLQQQQSKQFGTQQGHFPRYFQQSGQGTLQQQTLKPEQYLQHINRQLQKDWQNPFQQQPQSQQNTGTSSQKNYLDLLDKLKSGVENPNISTQQIADNSNKGGSFKVSALIRIIINVIILTKINYQKILIQKY
ncbi:unnamed protein product [Meloidogyne enterolobii]|uniref:Uncharacterized protein n=1 Tax=Meloidogyne enterolobii TaxID=390850 RepID=A0ACB1AXF5_MELEN